MRRGIFTAAVTVCALFCPVTMEGTASNRAAAPTPDNPTPAVAATGLKLDALVFEARVDPARLVEMDMEALNPAADDAAKLAKALAAWGRVTPAYRVCSRIALNDNVRFKMGTNAPFERGRSGGAGKQTNNVEYQDVGAALEVLAQATAPDAAAALRVRAKLELSGVARSRVAFDKDTQAPQFSRTSQDFSAVMQPGRPLVFMCTNAAVPDENGQAVAYVLRLVLRRDE